jgi:hypothetical protein
MTVTRRPIFIALVLIVISLTSCSEIKTSDAKETFKYWAGTNPPADIELLNGQYWQSSHWTKEYIMYLKLKPSKIWWDEFVKQNSLVVDTTKWSKPDDAPDWFEPTKDSKEYGQTGFSQGSQYFQDTTTGICYSYEIQL